METLYNIIFRTLDSELTIVHLCKPIQIVRDRLNLTHKMHVSNPRYELYHDCRLLTFISSSSYRDSIPGVASLISLMCHPL